MQSSPLKGLHTQVWTALLAALIAVGALIQIPIGPVPVTLQTFFIVLAGFILGPVSGAAAMILYILAGAIGLPIFAGGKAGFAILFGPTGGYLLGFIGTAYLAGFGKRSKSALMPFIWGILGLAFVYLVGFIRLKFVLDISYAKAAAIGIVPFIWADLAKVAAATVALRFLRKQGLLPE
ncbi:biotin transporter BioY [Halodesulfovibrio spirochaetisodalis]|uniref:Biotin transporter n=1 Tax=Halodesulfovibrio spirochaetisodalis TaxID=1560234 RepID=A0A1B7X988_9BACT|nr:biotin transporter BioY [Halodesulfovibrio spirochaetisodalis]OBQ45916.1 biotin biosynthesis protein BioY [Halodesulfovibrio spirochaetisodalis]